MRHFKRWALAISATVANLSACNPEASGVKRHNAGAAEAVAVASGPALVGYDIRRIRPQDAPLDAMFERMSSAARGDGKRLALFFSADWCDACKRLELEFGNFHPAGTIDDVRVLQFVEEDWEAKTRMDEVFELRSRYYPRLDNYPVLLLLDRDGKAVEEMADAAARFEAAGEAASMAAWFSGTRRAAAPSAVSASIGAPTD
ncbi:MAG: hypothetical protein B7733_12810 [Myxococcales bacterium FL481]|nr:MAG: hypothetical protein B7733_12810 [Myxococcales bacterium FL481]